LNTRQETGRDHQSVLRGRREVKVAGGHDTEGKKYGAMTSAGKSNAGADRGGRKKDRKGWEKGRRKED